MVVELAVRGWLLVSVGVQSARKVDITVNALVES